jgi:hypothetical protein
MTNNRNDELSYNDIVSNYLPLTPEQKQFWAFKASKFQIDQKLAPSYLRLPDGAEFIALWIEPNPVGHQVVVLERSRTTERMFNPKDLPLKLELDRATGLATIVPSADGIDYLTVEKGKQLLYPVAQCNAAAALIVKNRPGNVIGDSYLTDDGGFWTYEYHAINTLADYDELGNHFQEFRSWIELREARKFSGFGRSEILESGTDAHAEEFAKMSGL